MAEELAGSRLWDAAQRRVWTEVRLSVYARVLLDEGHGGDDYWRWLLTADVGEITDAARYWEINGWSGSQ